MAVLPEPSAVETVELPARKARLAAETDVLVVGGGPSGFGAAIGAARAGAKVVLVERYGFLGGAPTAALVNPMASFFTHGEVTVTPRKFSLFPLDHGKGMPVAAGILKELVARLVENDGALEPREQNGYTIPFDPEILKLTLMDLVDEAGVAVLLHAVAAGYLEGKVPGVFFETKSGPVVIKAKVIADCTGDGDVAACAGADYAVGRDSDSLTQPVSLLFRIAGFNLDEFREYAEEHPGEWDGVRGLEELVRAASKQGRLDLPREDMLFFGSTRDHEINVNSTRVCNVYGTNVWGLTRAEWESRRQMKQIESFLKSSVPGFKHAYVAQSGTTVCVRETRRITGDYILTEHDVLSARKFPDSIGKSTYPVDEHNPGGRGTVIKDVPLGDYYEIPLRCLLPRGLDKIVVGGRCISGTHIALSSYRVIPTAIVTGQAAGVCAALAAIKHNSVHTVPYLEVRKELISQDADL